MFTSGDKLETSCKWPSHLINNLVSRLWMSYEWARHKLLTRWVLTFLNFLVICEQARHELRMSRAWTLWGNSLIFCRTKNLFKSLFISGDEGITRCKWLIILAKNLASKFSVVCEWLMNELGMSCQQDRYELSCYSKTSVNKLDASCEWVGMNSVGQKF